NLVAETLDLDLLGFQLARDTDLREIGALYYLLASSDRLGETLDNAVRYASILNEAVEIRREANPFAIELEYTGIERYTDRHQAEFLLTCGLRMIRIFTGRHLVPTLVGFVHPHEGDVSEMERYFGCSLEFGTTRDRMSFDTQEAEVPMVTADPYLNRIMIQYFEDILARKESRRISLRTRVENAITRRLPHGSVTIASVASDLGMS